MNKGWWLIVVGAVGVAACVARGPESDGEAKPSAPVSSATKPAPKPTPTSTATDWWTDYDPAHFAVQVRKSAAVAKVNPQLLMAILYNESYKPHDPQFERSWQKIDSDPALGIANMHEAAFEDTQRGRRMPGRTWNELPDHPELAIEAAAWHLSDLARGLPDRLRTKLTRDELVALGYNAGRGNMRLFANGRKPGAQAQSYLDRLHDNWEKSAEAVRQ